MFYLFQNFYTFCWIEHVIVICSASWMSFIFPFFTSEDTWWQTFDSLTIMNIKHKKRCLMLSVFKIPLSFISLRKLSDVNSSSRSYQACSMLPFMLAKNITLSLARMGGTLSSMYTQPINLAVCIFLCRPMDAGHQFLPTSRVKPVNYAWYFKWTDENWAILSCLLF